MDASNSTFLVSCVAKKASTPRAAKDLYLSPWFEGARLYVEGKGQTWFILSAYYGLVDPEDNISPYDATLNRMSSVERFSWTQTVISQMERRMPAGDRCVILAGRRYRAGLVDYLRTRFRSVEIPMEGMRIGEQLRWLCEQTTAG